MKKMMISGRCCALYEYGTGGPVILWGASEPEAMQSVADLASGMAEGRAFVLLAYPVDSWNDGFSPWPAPPVFGSDAFGGRSSDTLGWLTECCLPALPDGPRFIGGYSLAGLFSLWALYESDAFSGACSCSGSLWYPGWTEYARAHRLLQDSIVYLSLGEREEKTRNRAMAAVGDCTRAQYALLKNDPAVRASTLVWHPGGHFTDPDRRMAEGIAWIVRNCNR